MTIQPILNGLRYVREGLRATVRRWRCSHRWVHRRNIYGDEIWQVDARSLWVCPDCGAYQYRRHLHPEPAPRLRVSASDPDSPSHHAP